MTLIVTLNPPLRRKYEVIAEPSKTGESSQRLSADDVAELVVEGRVAEARARLSAATGSEAELDGWRTALRTPSVLAEERASGETTIGNVLWLRHAPNDLRGKWVALRSGELVAVAGSRKELIKMLKTRSEVLRTVTLVHLD